MLPTEIIDRVIDGNFCIGCGACSFAQPDRFDMRFDGGLWKAVRNGQAASDISHLCPMSGRGMDEDEIAGRLYPALPADPMIGRYLYCGVGYVQEDGFRAEGGSGGLITWLLSRLLSDGLVDAVLHVKPTGTEGTDLMFAYGSSTGVAELRAGAKSRYFPIEMSKVLETVKRSNKRFAIVGLPCFLKAVRLLQEDGRLRREQTPFLIGLICGHLKSSYFAELLAWQKGIDPNQLQSIDFRVKLPDRPASQYGFAARAYRGGSPKVYPMADVVGHDWGEGVLKNYACEFCDDVIAECADIAIGDAWLPGHVDDPKGTNVCVVRSAAIQNIVAEGISTGALRMEEASAAVVAASQASGLRHRREGLSHRLERLGQTHWVPKKRVPPRLAPTSSRRRIYDLRLQIAATSNDLFCRAKQRNDLGYFLRSMAPIIARYHRAYRPTILARFLSRLRRIARVG